MSFKIILDSCGEQTAEMKADPRFASAALTLEVAQEQIIDDETFDQAEFLRKVAASPECPKSSRRPKYTETFSWEMRIICMQ